MSKSLPVAVLVLSAIMWGLTWWPLKHFHQQGLQGPLLILLGYGVVALVLLPGLWRERAAWRRESPYLWLMLLLFALGWLLLATVTALWAVTRLEAGRAAVILLVELLAGGCARGKRKGGSGHGNFRCSVESAGRQGAQSLSCRCMAASASSCARATEIPWWKSIERGWEVSSSSR